MGSIRKELGEQFSSLGTAMTIAGSVVFSTFAGVLTGYYLDTWLFDGRTYPWLTLICLLFGVAGGAKNFMILSKRFSKAAGEKGREKEEGPKGDAKSDAGRRTR
jgi:ATP synthase protein I